jgi:hypothetical protein
MLFTGMHVADLKCQTKFHQYNEEKLARMMTQKTALWSIIPKDILTSLLSLLTSHRGKICVQFSTGFWQKKTLSIWASCGIFIEKTDEISITLHWCTKSFQNKCHNVLFGELTKNNLRKWIVRYDRCQRRVADKTLYYVHCSYVHIWTFCETLTNLTENGHRLTPTQAVSLHLCHAW